MDERATGLVLELERVLQASQERVFRARPEPAELLTWWGPQGYTIAEIDLDLRVGGSYRFTVHSPGGDPFRPCREFRAIDAPSRQEPDPDDRTIVFTLSRLEAGHAAEMSLRRDELATEARLALHRDGWTGSFTKRGELLEPDSLAAVTG